MNPAASTGATCRRNPSSVSRWIRASSRRSHHSISPAWFVNWPRNTEPGQFQLLQRNLHVGQFHAKLRGNPCAVVGPLISNRPRTSSIRASSFVTSVRNDSGSDAGGVLSASDSATFTAGQRSTAIHNGRPADNFASHHPALLFAAASNNGRQFAALRSPAAPRPRADVSCSSSASRTTGHASARTCAIASGSSRPKSRTSSGRNVRRTATARARRSSSGASSRNAYTFAFTS